MTESLSGCAPGWGGDLSERFSGVPRRRVFPQEIPGAGSRGFTLLELLVVITIVVILAALLLPALRNVTAGSRDVKCKSNLRQLGVAARLYGNEHDSDLPIGRADVTGAGGMPAGSLNWYDGMALYLGRPAQKDSTGKLLPLPAVFACPDNLAKHNAQKPPTADPAFPSWPYTGDFAYNDFLNPYPQIVGCVTKFTQLTHQAQTVMIGEVAYQNQWDRITLYPKTQGILGMRHAGADNMLWCDGHVSRMTYDELKALATDIHTPWKGNQQYFYQGVDAP